MSPYPTRRSRSKATTSRAKIGINMAVVCVYISKTIPFNVNNYVVTTDIKSIWVDIILKMSKPIIVGCVYRPPKQHDFLIHFQDTLSSLPPNQESIILGDFNICELLESYQRKQYQYLLKSNRLCQIINKPTRLTDKTSTLLYHVLVNKRENISQSGTIPIGFSDHDMFFCTRKICRKQVNGVNKIVTIRSMKNYTREVLVDKLNQVDSNLVRSVKIQILHGKTLKP